MNLTNIWKEIAFQEPDAIPIPRKRQHCSKSELCSQVVLEFENISWQLWTLQRFYYLIMSFFFWVAVLASLWRLLLFCLWVFFLSTRKYICPFLKKNWKDHCQALARYFCSIPMMCRFYMLTKQASPAQTLGLVTAFLSCTCFSYTSYLQLNVAMWFKCSFKSLLSQTDCESQRIRSLKVGPVVPITIDRQTTVMSSCCGDVQVKQGN